MVVSHLFDLTLSISKSNSSMDGAANKKPFGSRPIAYIILLMKPVGVFMSSNPLTLEKSMATADPPWLTTPLEMLAQPAKYSTDVTVFGGP